MVNSQTTERLCQKNLFYNSIIIIYFFITARATTRACGVDTWPPSAHRYPGRGPPRGVREGKKASRTRQYEARIPVTGGPGGPWAPRVTPPASRSAPFFPYPRTPTASSAIRFAARLSVPPSPPLHPVHGPHTHPLSKLPLTLGWVHGPRPQSLSSVQRRQPPPRRPSTSVPNRHEHPLTQPPTRNPTVTWGPLPRGRRWDRSVIGGGPGWGAVTWGYYPRVSPHGLPNGAVIYKKKEEKKSEADIKIPKSPHVYRFVSSLSSSRLFSLHFSRSESALRCEREAKTRNHGHGRRRAAAAGGGGADGGGDGGGGEGGGVRGDAGAGGVDEEGSRRDNS